jgi:hypothetical protein
MCRIVIANGIDAYKSYGFLSYPLTKRGLLAEMKRLLRPTTHSRELVPDCKSSACFFSTPPHGFFLFTVFYFIVLKTTETIL